MLDVAEKQEEAPAPKTAADHVAFDALHIIILQTLQSTHTGIAALSDPKR
jgi:hypothetical protein